MRANRAHGFTLPSIHRGGTARTARRIVVTAFVLEYGSNHPTVDALALLPIYDGIARVKTWGHWQTDVKAGFALGAAAGYLLHRPGTPVILSILPHRFEIGFRKEF